MIETIKNDDGSITTRTPDPSNSIDEPVGITGLSARQRIRIFIALIIAVILTIGISYTKDALNSADGFVSGPGVLSSSEKYIAFDGPAQRTYQPIEGTITYCDPDDHGRPQTQQGRAHNLVQPRLEDQERRRKARTTQTGVRKVARKNECIPPGHAQSHGHVRLQGPNRRERMALG